MKEGHFFSPVIAGVMNWGVWGSNLDTKTMAGLIEDCMTNGIWSFDHADIYGGYTTEISFGLALKESGVERSNIQLISKCGICYPCEARPQYTTKAYDTSALHIKQSVENSLRNLGTDYLDVLLIHRPSPLMNYHEIADTFGELITSGKVKHFGVSNFNRSQFEHLNGLFPLITNQVEASILHLDPFQDGTIDQGLLYGISITAWSPLAGGKLFARSTDYELVSRRSRIVQVCEKYHWEIDMAAYLFLLHHPASIIPVTGSAKLDRILMAQKALEIEITDGQWFELWSASTGHKVP